MSTLLGLLAIVLAIGSANAHASCKPPKLPIKDPHTEYESGETALVACSGDHTGKYYTIQCRPDGNWLMMSNGCHDTPKVTKKPPSPPANKKAYHTTFDHYHPPGDRHYHKDDTPPHYHPGKGVVVKPQPPKPSMKPQPPTTKPPTAKPPTSRPVAPKPCPSIPGLTPGSFSGFPYGFSVIGIPCPGSYPDIYYGMMFDITCDENGSGRWLMRQDACGGLLFQQQNAGAQRPPYYMQQQQPPYYMQQQQPQQQPPPYYMQQQQPQQQQRPAPGFLG